MCKPGLRAAPAVPLDGVTGRGQLCRVAQVRTTDLLKGSQGLPTFEKELGERPGCGWGGCGGASQLLSLPPPPCPQSPWPHSCLHPSQAPGDVSLTLSPGRDTNPLAVSSPHCWDLLAFSQRTSINTKGEQKGSNYRKYKQHENSQVSKVQVSRPQITTLELKTLACLPQARADSSPCRLASWLLGGQGPGQPPPHHLRLVSHLRICLGHSCSV